jgi:hypothetical protein
MSNQLINDVNQRYLNSEFNNILHTVSDAYIPVDITHNNIALTISGGADSALLAYIVCFILQLHQKTPTIHVITTIRGWRSKPWQEHISLCVFNYLVNAFPSITFNRHVSFVPPELEDSVSGRSCIDEYGNTVAGDVLILRAFSEYILFKTKSMSWYTAVNKNPPGLANGLPERYLVDIKFDKIIKYSKDNILLLKPFYHIEKDWIISAYKDLGIHDLFEITRSCEGDSRQFPEIFAGLDYRTYAPGQYLPQCGKCFWCEERNWGVNNA